MSGLEGVLRKHFPEKADEAMERIRLMSFLHSQGNMSGKTLHDEFPGFFENEDKSSKFLMEFRGKRGGGLSSDIKSLTEKAGIQTSEFDFLDEMIDNSKGVIKLVAAIVFCLAAVERLPIAGPLFSAAADLVVLIAPSVGTLGKDGIQLMVSLLPLPYASFVGMGMGWMFMAGFLIFTMSVQFSRMEFKSALLNWNTLILGNTFGIIINNMITTGQRVYGNAQKIKDSAMSAFESAKGLVTDPKTTEQLTQGKEAIKRVLKGGNVEHGPDTELLLQKIRDCDGIKLDVSKLNITSLPPLPAGLKRLECHNTRLTTLPPLPAGLRVLYCHHTPLTILPPLPAELQELTCYETPLTTLPPLPTGLKWLDCDHTPLTTLPPLPTGLRELYCQNTSLTTLPPLPAGLQRLNCSHTSLTTLPPLPASLNLLDCSHTPLTSLPPLPAGLQVLDCSDTPLTSLPPLPTRLLRLHCPNCPNLLIQRNPGESIAKYEARWNVVRNEPIVPALPPRILLLRSGETDPITLDEILTDDILIDRNNEMRAVPVEGQDNTYIPTIGRFYSEQTANQLTKSPITREMYIPSTKQMYKVQIEDTAYPEKKSGGNRQRSNGRKTLRKKYNGRTRTHSARSRSWRAGDQFRLF